MTVGDQYDQRADAELASLLRLLAEAFEHAEVGDGLMGHLIGPCGNCWARDHGIEPELVLRQAAGRLGAMVVRGG
jgi:hypothetical protein